MFAGELTRYTTRHTKVSYCLAYQCSQVNLRATPPDTPRSATASHINVRRSTYTLHHQTHQGQLLPFTLMFAGRLTSYNHNDQYKQQVISLLAYFLADLVSGSLSR
jgi:hypothetical protein